MVTSSPLRLWFGLVPALLLAKCGGTTEEPTTNSPVGDTGSVNEEDAGAPPVPAGATSGPGAFQQDYVTSDRFFTRLEEPLPSSIHARQRTWYSTNIQDFPMNGPFTVPEGTVAIKAEYDTAGQNFITVVMIKQAEGYDSEHNDWYYEARLPDGSQGSDPPPGRAMLCINCHQGGAETDYLLGFHLEN